jgi:hypothetical protein
MQVYAIAAGALIVTVHATNALAISSNTLALHKGNVAYKTVEVAAQKSTSSTYGCAKMALSGKTLTIPTT